MYFMHRQNHGLVLCITLAHQSMKQIVPRRIVFVMQGAKVRDGWWWRIATSTTLACPAGVWDKRRAAGPCASSRDLAVQKHSLRGSTEVVDESMFTLIYLGFRDSYIISSLPFNACPRCDLRSPNCRKPRTMTPNKTYARGARTPGIWTLENLEKIRNLFARTFRSGSRHCRAVRSFQTFTLRKDITVSRRKVAAYSSATTKTPAWVGTLSASTAPLATRVLVSAREQAAYFPP